MEHHPSKSDSDGEHHAASRSPSDSGPSQSSGQVKVSGPTNGSDAERTSFIHRSLSRLKPLDTPRVEFYIATALAFFLAFPITLSIRVLFALIILGILIDLILRSPLTISLKPLTKIFLIIITFIAVACLIYSLINNRNETESASVRTMFARECEKPLDSIFVIYSLDTTLWPNELKNFGTAVLLSPSRPDHKERGLIISANTVVTDPSLGVGPPFGRRVPGMLCRTWDYITKTPLTAIMIWNYSSGLDRIESGSDDIVGKSAIGSLGELDHTHPWLLVTESLTKVVDRISIVANDYVIWDYPVQKNSWKAVSGRSDFAVASLPSHIQDHSWFILESDTRETIPEISFADQMIRRHQIVAGNLARGRVSSTVLPGKTGWLPRDNGTY